MHLSEEKERVPNYRPVFVTEISDNLHFYAQDVETGNSVSLYTTMTSCSLTYPIKQLWHMYRKQQTGAQSDSTVKKKKKTGILKLTFILIENAVKTLLYVMLQ